MKHVVRAPYFKVGDFIGFDAAKKHKIINLNWIKNPLVSLSTINLGKYISLFRAKAKEHISEDHVPRFPIEFYNRKPGSEQGRFLWTRSWKFSHDPLQNILETRSKSAGRTKFSQVMHGDVFNAEYNNICDLTRQENCHLEVVMSDSNSLAQFWHRRVMVYLLVNHQSIKMLKNQVIIICRPTSRIFAKVSLFCFFFPNIRC